MASHCLALVLKDCNLIGPLVILSRNYPIFACYASSEFIHDFDSFLYYVFSIYIYILAISLLPRAMILPFILDKDVETSTRYFNFKSVSIIYKAKKYQSNSLHNYNYTEMHRFIYYLIKGLRILMFFR